MFRYYPRKKPDIKERELPIALKQQISQELRESKYGNSMTEYIKSCKRWIQLEYPNVATIHVICDSQNAPPIALLIRTLKRVACLLRAYHIKKCLTFYLLPTPLTRTFPQKGHMIESRHINGGYTYPQKNVVYIFRYEEFPKVMIHETVHHLPMDLQYWPKHVMRAFYNVLSIDSHGCSSQCRTDLAPGEAIVEAWAEIFHLRFLQWEYGWSFDDMIAIEQNWAATQAKRLLMHQHKYFKQWREETHAYSYIIIRAALLHNYKEFVQKKYPYVAEDMANFMLSSLTKQKFRDALQKTALPKTQSLRMTVFGNM